MPVVLSTFLIVKAPITFLPSSNAGFEAATSLRNLASVAGAPLRVAENNGNERPSGSNAAQYPDVKKQIDDWYATVSTVNWENLADVRRIYRNTDAVGNFTVFNIKGNEYRLIVGIDYENQTVFYKYFLTHPEYDKDKWKVDCD